VIAELLGLELLELPVALKLLDLLSFEGFGDRRLLGLLELPVALEVLDLLSLKVLEPHAA
jgi:hypothetical protein